MAQVGLAIGVMAALIATSGSPSGSEPIARARQSTAALLSSPGERAAAARRIEALFADIPQRGRALGRPDAPVTLQFFADLECLEARQFVLGSLPFVVRRWVRGGKLRIVYHGFPAETVWADIFSRQQAAALAAGEQGKLWQYIDFFYHHQGLEFTRYAIAYFLEAMAKEVPGLDLDGWQAQRHEATLIASVRADVRLGREHGFHPHGPWTPAFFVGPTGGPARPVLHFSLTEPAAFDEAVEGVLAERG